MVNESNFMSVHNDTWMIAQVQRLANTRPERLTVILSQLKESLPEAYEELPLTALEHGDLTLSDCAGRLGVDQAELQIKQESYRTLLCEANEFPMIAKDSQGTARVKGTMVAVWEIVRKFRKAASVLDLKESFPSLTELELRSALAYAGRHPDEVQAHIAAYEELRKQANHLAVVNSTP